MARDLDQQREHAHSLLDMLPPEKLDAVHTLLEVMIEPLSRSLHSVPIENKDINATTSDALSRARASLKRGEGIPHEEILKEFGLQP